MDPENDQKEDVSLDEVVVTASRDAILELLYPESMREYAHLASEALNNRENYLGDYLIYAGYMSKGIGTGIFYYGTLGRGTGIKTAATTLSKKLLTKLGLNAAKSKAKQSLITVPANIGTSLVTKYPGVPAILGTAERTALMKGTVIDRYGPLGGKWFSTPGTSYGARSIPNGIQPYTQFEVLKPFEVVKSIASPGGFAGQVGFGVQYESAVSAATLVEKGIIKALTK